MRGCAVMLVKLGDSVGDVGRVGAVNFSRVVKRRVVGRSLGCAIFGYAVENWVRSYAGHGDVGSGVGGLDVGSADRDVGVVVGTFVRRGRISLRVCALMQVEPGEDVGTSGEVGTLEVVSAT